MELRRLGGPALSPCGGRRGVLVALTLLAGCVADVGHDVTDYDVVARVPPVIRERLDILFVIDNTTGMAAQQEQLAAAFVELHHDIGLLEGDPDVHVGVVSSDMGIRGGATLATCNDLGDDGALQRAAEACLQSGQPWLDVTRPLLDIPDNPITGEPYAELYAQFACMVALGEAGCSVEQPLSAMRRALDGSQPANEGFLRDDAALAVITLSGEDDCSSDGSLFDGDGFDKFRCFREGVRCQSDDVGIGVQLGCQPNEHTTRMVDVAGDAAFLRDLKHDASAVVIGSLVGDPGTVTVVDNTGSLAVAPACVEPDKRLYPGVRLGAFAAELGGVTAPLCKTSSVAAMEPIGKHLHTAMGDRCLHGSLRDISDDVPGLQVDCMVTAVDAGGNRASMAACADQWNVTGTPPCWVIKDGRCGEAGDRRLAVYVNWGGDHPNQAPLGTTTEVSCLTDPEVIPE